MRKVKLVVEYDGKDFVGWQLQDNGRSVQGVLEEALKSLLQEEVRIVGAGRTDAGVHARGQTAHFETESTMPPASLQRGLNALLPDDVVVRGVSDVSPEFHARYGAKWRQYSYTICREQIAIARGFAWYLDYKLDEDALNRCANEILGDVDFRAFCKASADPKHYRCIVRSAKWKTVDAGLRFEIEANRFLYGMVRALVGTMVEIARGLRPEEDFRRILESGDRKQAGMAAPASGLVLERVLYENGDGKDAS